ncbi:MAG: imidazole glycerol phosphate synthase subunit HisF [bacterium]|nr:imidazole glycerol phosphate synthase subunit HisF [bacterium]
MKSGLAKRIIPCLDICDGRVVKGMNFRNLQDAGDPVDLSKLYCEMGADELIFLDITATNEKRKTLVKLVSRIAENISIPFTVGGGISSIEDIDALLKAGADKVSICSAAFRDPSLVEKAARKFGSQCIVISVDCAWNKDFWEIYVKGGSEATGADALSFAKKMASLGAGELLVNSLDRDGTCEGYDIELLKTISSVVNIPIIASSGAGCRLDFLKALTDGNADGALAANLFHYNKITIPEIKNYLKSNNIAIRI